MAQQPLKNVDQDKLGAKAERVKDSASRTAKEASELGEMSYEELKDQLELVKAEVAELTVAMKKAGRQTAHDAAEVLRKHGRQAAERVSENYEYATDQFDEALGSAEEFARERPAVALGIAAGAGFLLALFMTRR